MTREAQGTLDEPARVRVALATLDAATHPA